MVSRRDLLKMLGTGAAVTSFGGLISEPSQADMAQNKRATRGTLYDGKDALPCRIENGRIVRPSVEVPSVETTDVLVLGGGPAGCVAAIAAARAGAKTTLVERHNHFGGLSTGGLVLIILGHWTEGKVQVVQGIGEEMMQRLEKMPYGIISRQPGVNPTIDAEAYKYLLVEMLQEAGVSIWLHSWASDAIVEGNVVQGAVFQTKIGPRAILAKQTIDTTGDGDIFASAGAAYDRRTYNIGLPCRYGDMPTLEKGEIKPRGYGDPTPIDGIRWLNMGGKTTDGLDPKILSQLELEYRAKIWKDYLNLRKIKKFENVKLIETAPQLGVRVTRVLKGVKEINITDFRNKKKYDDMVGCGGAWSGDHQLWQLPYGALVSENMDNILTAGRSLSAAPEMSDLIRVIPNCWMSGQAAGCAAACAVKQDVTARKVDLREVRELLLQQKAYLES